MSESPLRPQEYVIEVDGKEIQVLKAIDGKEYLNIVNSEKYTGFSRYMLYQKIREKESKLGRKIRNELKGKASYIEREMLDELIKEVYTPKLK